MGVRLWWDEKSQSYYVGICHKGYRKSHKAGKDKKQAERLRRQVETALLTGAYFQSEKREALPTVADYYQTFKRSYLETAGLRSSTIESYEGSFRRHILPDLGKLLLNEVTLARVDDFISGLVRKGLAKDTVRIHVAALRKLLNHAMRRDLITKNPASAVGDLLKKSTRIVHDEIEPLTADEVPLFLQTVVQNWPYYYSFFLAAIHTGMRSGELKGLQWGDIDFQKKFAIVRRSIDNKRRVNGTKTNKVRRVDLSDSLLQELQLLKARRAQEWKARGNDSIPEWVFCTQEGTPLDTQNVKNRVFFKCLEKAGLRRIRFHDLRHTYASLLIQNSESMKYVQEQLGHSSIKVTLDVYSHLIPGANREAVNRLPALVPGSTSITTLLLLKEKAAGE